MSTYLITQATGGQSGWVITHLLAAGAKVHAVIRNLNKELPAVLKSPGVTLFQGESHNFDDIYKAAQGCQGVFLNTFPRPGLEAQQAKTILEAAKKAGVETLVSSSTVGTDDEALRISDAVRDCQLDAYYASKHEVEGLVRGAAGFKAYTIVRPAVIHFDLCTWRHEGNFPRLASHGELDDLMTPGSKLPFTDAGDIGKYVAAALLDGPLGKFANQEIDLYNELLDFDEVAAIMNRVSGKHVKAVKRTFEELQGMGAFVFGQAFHLLTNVQDFSTKGGAAAAAVQSKFGIPFTSLEEGLTRDKALLMEILANVD
ncbi:hypothetical protein PG994_009959 [Apiospora phragmitis]|uniref:NmrA-like domain-containing protein n=1 Tax=Apiospora phragmitis TaxID=2905665 RepID=A0ABR1TR47_9PEZI